MRKLIQFIKYLFTSCDISPERAADLMHADNWWLDEDAKP